MSTKTIYKRIALVAVASLGFGVLTSVSPARATVAGAAIADVSDAVEIGGTATTAVVFTTTADGETATLTMSVPSGSAITLTDNNGAAAGTADVLIGADGSNSGATQDDTIFDPATGVITDTTTADDADGDITIIPDVVGTYTFTLTAGATTDTYTVYAADLFVSVADGISSGDESKLTGNGVAGVSNNVTLGFRSQTDARQIRVTGSTVVSVSDTTAMTISSDKTTIDVLDGAAADLTFKVATPTAGTITVNAYDETQGGIFSTTSYGTVTITVNAVAVKNVYSAAKSTFYANTGGTAGTEADNTTYSAAGALSASAAINVDAEVANVTVTQKDADGNNLTSGFKTVSATITGAGLLSTSTAASGASVSSSAGAVTTVAAYANGTVGKGVIAVSVDGVVVKTITVTFYGAVKTLTATVKKSNVPVSTTNAAAVINVLAVDELGQPVANTPVITSATPGVISSGTCAASNPATPVEAVCTVTSTATTGSSVLTIAAGGDATVKTTVTINVTRALANTAVLTTNKASYAPGEEATLTLTLTDKDGKPVGSADYTTAIAAGGLATSAAITTKLAFNATTDTTITVLDGKATVKFFVPVATGPVTIQGTLAAGFSEGGVAKTITPVTFTVAAPANAEIATLTTLVNSLIAKINALNKLVIKIQKKVRA